MKTLETKVVIHIDTPHVWEYVRALASSCFEGYEGGGGGETRMLLPKLRLNMNDSGAGTRLNKRKWKDCEERREKAYLQKHLLHHFLIDSKTLVFFTFVYFSILSSCSKLAAACFFCRLSFAYIW